MNITILFPVYNENKNIPDLINQLEEIINKNKKHNFKILFIDNDSRDGTQETIKEICKNKKYIQAIFNKKNYGTLRSPFYGLTQSTGDATILLPADFQTPLSVIPDLISSIENGYDACLLKKKTTQDNFFLKYIRKFYYKLINHYSESKILQDAPGDGIFSKLAISEFKKYYDPFPYLRGIISESGIKYDILTYDHQKRLKGISSYNFFNYFEFAVLSFVRQSRSFLRLMILLGMILSFISFTVAIVFFVYKILNWDAFSVGVAPIVIGIFGLGSFQLFLMGILGEYLITILDYQKKFPTIVEKERINFD